MKEVKMLNPVTDRLIIKAEEQDTVRGFAVVDSSKRPQTGKVIGAGPDCKVAKVDSKVLFHKGAGSTIEYDGEQLLVMREHDLLAVISD